MSNGGGFFGRNSPSSWLSAVSASLSASVTVPLFKLLLHRILGHAIEDLNECELITDLAAGSVTLVDVPLQTRYLQDTLFKGGASSPFSSSPQTERNSLGDRLVMVEAHAQSIKLSISSNMERIQLDISHISIKWMVVHGSTLSATSKHGGPRSPLDSSHPHFDSAPEEVVLAAEGVSNPSFLQKLADDLSKRVHVSLKKVSISLSSSEFGDLELIIPQASIKVLKEGVISLPSWTVELESGVQVKYRGSLLESYHVLFATIDPVSVTFTTSLADPIFLDIKKVELTINHSQIRHIGELFIYLKGPSERMATSPTSAATSSFSLSSSIEGISIKLEKPSLSEKEEACASTMDFLVLELGHITFIRSQSRFRMEVGEIGVMECRHKTRTSSEHISMSFMPIINIGNIESSFPNPPVPVDPLAQSVYGDPAEDFEHHSALVIFSKGGKIDVKFDYFGIYIDPYLIAGFSSYGFSQMAPPTKYSPENPEAFAAHPWSTCSISLPSIRVRVEVETEPSSFALSLESPIFSLDSGLRKFSLSSTCFRAFLHQTSSISSSANFRTLYEFTFALDERPFLTYQNQIDSSTLKSFAHLISGHNSPPSFTSANSDQASENSSEDDWTEAREDSSAREPMAPAQVSSDELEDFDLDGVKGAFLNLNWEKAIVRLQDGKVISDLRALLKSFDLPESGERPFDLIVALNGQETKFQIDDLGFSASLSKGNHIIFLQSMFVRYFMTAPLAIVHLGSHCLSSNRVPGSKPCLIRAAWKFNDFLSVQCSNMHAFGCIDVIRMAYARWVAFEAKRNKQPLISNFKIQVVLSNVYFTYSDQPIGSVITSVERITISRDFMNVNMLVVFLKSAELPPSQEGEHILSFDDARILFHPARIQSSPILLSLNPGTNYTLQKLLGRFQACIASLLGVDSKSESLSGSPESVSVNVDEHFFSAENAVNTIPSSLKEAYDMLDFSNGTDNALLGEDGEGEYIHVKQAEDFIGASETAPYLHVLPLDFRIFLERGGSSSEFIEIQLRGISILASVSNSTSNLLIRIEEGTAIDGLHTSTYRTIVSRLSDLAQGSQETLVPIAVLKFSVVKLFQPEHVLSASVAPLRIYLDQDVLEFILAFNQIADQDVSSIITMHDLDSILDETLSSAEQFKSSKNASPYFQSVDIDPVCLVVDYCPKRVDMAKLSTGQSSEAMNVFQVEEAVFKFESVRVIGAAGWPALVRQILQQYLPQIRQTPLADLLSGVTVIRPLVRVGSSLLDLVLFPLNANHRDGNAMFSGLKEKAMFFVKTSAFETLRLGDKLASGVESWLEEIDDFVIPAESNSQSTRIGGSSSSATLPAANRYARPVKNMAEGLVSGYEALHSDIKVAMDVLVSTASSDLNQGSSSVKVAMKTLPVVVIKPLLGATRALSKTLQGLRASVDPQSVSESSKKYKSRA